MSKIRNKGALQASMFRRLAIGAGVGVRVKVKAIAPDAIEREAQREAQQSGPRELTPRQRMEQRQVFYFLRESHRRVQSMLTAEAHSAGDTDTGTSYQWTQKRPARRSVTACVPSGTGQ